MFSTRQNGSITVTSPAGAVRLGEDNVRLRDHMRTQLDAGHRKLLMDLSRVTFMDSSGVGLLVEIKAHAMHVDGDLRLCNVPPDVSTILSRLMLNTILTVYGTEESAMAEWGEGQTSGA